MNRIVPLVLAALAALGLLSASLFVVDQRQFAVVYALGEIRQVIDKPGLHFKLPPPFQNVQYFDKRILTIDNPDIDRFITSEKLNVQIDTYVKWRITEPKSFIRSVSGSEVIAADRISRSLRDALNNEIAKRTVAEVISGNRDQIMAGVLAKVNEDAKQIGAAVVDVRLKRVDFAPEVQERVFDRMQSERKRVANERRATGAAESEKIRADADRQREVVLAEAYRDAQKIKGEGDAKASAIYASAFGQDPAFAQFYRSLEAYRASFRNRSDLLVVDPSAEFFRYLKSSGSAGAPAPRAK
jgi:membrane protease subunit HflC